MNAIVDWVHDFLSAIIRELGEDVRSITRWLEENGLLTVLVEVLEIIGLSLLDSIRVLISVPNKKPEVILQ